MPEVKRSRSKTRTEPLDVAPPVSSLPRVALPSVRREDISMRVVNAIHGFEPPPLVVDDPKHAPAFAAAEVAFAAELASVEAPVLSFADLPPEFPLGDAAAAPVEPAPSPKADPLAAALADPALVLGVYEALTSGRVVLARWESSGGTRFIARSVLGGELASVFLTEHDPRRGGDLFGAKVGGTISTQDTDLATAKDWVRSVLRARGVLFV